MPEDRTTFHLSQDRQVIEARILKAFREHPGDFEYLLPYEELNDLVGGDVSADVNLSSKVRGAVRSVERMLNIKLGREPGKGIVQLPADQYLGFVENETARVRRKSKRLATEAGRLATLPGIPQEDRQGIIARGSLAGAIAAFAGKKSVERISHAAAGSDQPLSLNRTLDAFRKKA